MSKGKKITLKELEEKVGIKGICKELREAR